ncbi:N-acetyltransferase family protein [Streptomyces spiralis]|uniref:N-acetyltransferase n=1 Tax=Streptomyces spiralis TaxID=66376 RepID=A0A919DUP1_9ACTN|nr:MULTISPECIES: GNAT family N-acetyltransferase [Streptomyces]GHE79510.1 N-acetyltransferase [Streptomyces spiralis]
MPPAVCVRRAGPGDLDGLGRMVLRCSAESIRDRMHGGTRRDDLLREMRDTVLHGDGTVLVAAERHRTVGCLELVRRAPGAPRAEMALLVEDDRQGRGIGTRLLDAVPACARSAGIAVVGFSVEAGNGRARRLLRHLPAGGLQWQWQQATLEATWHVGALR